MMALAAPHPVEVAVPVRAALAVMAAAAAADLEESAVLLLASVELRVEPAQQEARLHAQVVV